MRFSPLFGEGTPRAHRRRTILLAASVGAHVLLGLVVAVLPARYVRVEDPLLPMTITLTAPIPAVEQPTPVPHPPRPRREPTPPPKSESKRAPTIETPPTPKPEPKPDVVPPNAPPAPPKPVPVVRTNVFQSTSPERSRTVPNRSIEMAEGFESPNARDRNTAPQRVVAVAQGFDREDDHIRPNREPAVLAAAGFEGTIHASPRDAGPPRAQIVPVGLDVAAARPTSTRPTGGVVRPAGIDDPVPTAPTRSTNGVVHSGGFDVVAPPASERKAKPHVETADTAVEIVSKPNPVYSEEARRLRIEGDVVLRVTFRADGTLVVLGVVDGLGHGLDAAAVDAARKVVFRPARRDGQPVDSTAVLRVVFRLA